MLLKEFLIPIEIPAHRLAKDIENPVRGMDESPDDPLRAIARTGGHYALYIAVGLGTWCSPGAGNLITRGGRQNTSRVAAYLAGKY